MIERGLKTFVEVGKALAEIQDGKLYRRQGYATFEDYCQQRWGMARQTAYDHVKASEVAENVRTCVQNPPSLAHAREMASLSPEQQREVASRVDFANTTVRELKEEIKQVRDPEPDPEPNPEPTPEPDPEPEPKPAPKMAVHFSSDSEEWYTPPEVLARAVKALGAIDLDPCSNSADSPNVPAILHFTQEDDGLSRMWGGRVYMNPPYGRAIDAWAEKLCAEYAAGNVSEAVALVPARVDTDWFRRFRDAVICFIDGRLKFSGHENSAPFPSAVIYLGTRIEAFASAFSDMGDLWVRYGR
jgi:hypothetical protein